MDDLATNGFAVLKGVMTSYWVDALRPLAAADAPGRRNLLVDHPLARQACRDSPLMNVARRILGSSAQPVRALFFDKTPSTNWGVPWHQDQNIAVAERRETPGYGPWSTKAGVVHVVPPRAVLEAMITLRLHLDDCDAENGPLRVLPGSHRWGLLKQADIDDKASSTTAMELLAQAGDVVAMRPLLVHASQPARAPSHRRVFHVEYSAGSLACRLRWHTELPHHETKSGMGPDNNKIGEVGDL